VHERSEMDARLVPIAVTLLACLCEPMVRTRRMRGTNPLVRACPLLHEMPAARTQTEKPAPDLMETKPRRRGLSPMYCRQRTDALRRARSGRTTRIATIGARPLRGIDLTRRKTLPTCSITSSDGVHPSKPDQRVDVIRHNDT